MAGAGQREGLAAAWAMHGGRSTGFDERILQLLHTCTPSPAGQRADTDLLG
jgi:hypothetical protein